MDDVAALYLDMLITEVHTIRMFPLKFTHPLQANDPEELASPSPGAGESL